MNKKFLAKTAAAVAVLGLTLSATPAFAAGQAIAGKGSSFANGALQYCLSHYDPATNDTATYTSTGSGVGRSEFAAGTVDWAATDGLYAAADKQPASYVTVPLLGGPVVFAYNTKSGLPKNLKLDADTVSQILKGTINKWNDDAIAALNPTVKKLPNATIKTFYRDASGTTENLTNYLLQNVPSAGWTKSKDLTAQVKTNTNATVKATSSVLADKVQSTKYAFGYFDLSDAVSAKVYYAALQNANGDFVSPTAATGAKFLGGQTAVVDATSSRTDGTLTIDFTKKIKGAYQLTIVTYGLAPKGATTDKAKAVQGWFNYVVATCMPAKAAKLGYVPLPTSLKNSALAQIATIAK